MIAVLEHTDLDTDTTDTDEPIVAHYYDIEDLNRVITDDATITALCGKKDQPVLAGEGLPVCGECRHIYDQKETG